MSDLPATPLTLTALSALGVGRRRLDRLVDDGVVRRQLRGVYVRADLRDTLDLRAQCAALVLPAHAVVCDRSAAWLWGVDCLEPGEHEFLPRLETVSVSGNDRVRRGEVYGGKRDLRPDEIAEVRGMRVTTPVRTACDLACLRGRRSALAVYDAFRRHCGLTCHDYQRMLVRFAGRRGVRQARELAPYAITGAESQGESWLRADIIDGGLRPPDAQVWVHLPGLGWVRLDLAYEHLRVAIEYDGEEFHSTHDQRIADTRRRDALRRAGWLVIVVTKADFRAGADGAWLGELNAAIAARVPTYRRIYSRGESWDPRRR